MIALWYILYSCLITCPYENLGFFLNFSYVSNLATPFGTLQVGNGVQLKCEVSGKLIGIQLYDNWYIGGVPPGLDMLNKTKGQAAPSSSFVGSIKDVQVNGETINFAGSTFNM